MKLRVGIIGCGLITQVMHLHYLRELNELFEVSALCDVSPSTLEKVGDQYGIPNRYSDWKEMLKSGIDLVMVLTPGTHAPIAIAAAQAGKHVFVEKPMCYTMREADEMIAAAKKSNVILMVGNMIRYDPGYNYGIEQFKQMKNVLFARATTLESPIKPYVQHLPLYLGARDVPQEVRTAFMQQAEQLTDEALGHVDELGKRVYRGVLLDSLVHEVNALRGILGEPEKILFTDIMKDGEVFTTVIRFPNELDCTLSWVNLPELPNYSQELAFYSPEKRVSIKFPSPFLRSQPTPVYVEEMAGAGAWEQEVKVSYEEAFKLELVHLHKCVQEGSEPVTNAMSAKRDIAVLQTMIKSWHSKQAEVIPTF